MNQDDVWAYINGLLKQSKTAEQPVKQEKYDDLDLALDKNAQGIVDSKGKPWFYTFSAPSIDKH